MLIRNVLLCGSDTWTTRKRDLYTTEAFTKWRHMQGYNKQLRGVQNSQGSNTFERYEKEKGALDWFLRANELLTMIFEEKVDGQKKTGEDRNSWIASVVASVRLHNHQNLKYNILVMY